MSSLHLEISLTFTVNYYFNYSTQYLKWSFDEYLYKVREKHSGYNHCSWTHSEPLINMQSAVCS